VRELDEQLERSELIAEILPDSRTSRARFSLVGRLRHLVCCLLIEYQDVNAAGRVSRDPVFRLIGSEKLWDRGAARRSRLLIFGMMIANTAKF
jgi:hypothetical protein